jgi:hypothetical protein
VGKRGPINHTDHVIPAKAGIHCYLLDKQHASGRPMRLALLHKERALRKTRIGAVRGKKGVQKVIKNVSKTRITRPFNDSKMRKFCAFWVSF